MQELTSEQFMALADGVFDTAEADGSRHPRAVCPRCDTEGPVLSGTSPGTLMFEDCGHAFGVPIGFRKPSAGR
ncbi:hypothetical protein [Streptomyces sp. NPDC059928]|uniref:hypothetical protein n=1 Tax=unclassified Streptomyces TaxID=2593676 RepID=UPI00364946AD